MFEKPSHIILFNDERYLQYNLQTGQRLFRYDHALEGRLVGTLGGVVDHDELICGYSAPYGGLDFIRRREAVGSIVEMIQAASLSAASVGIRTIRIRHRPGYYGENETALEFALLNLGASVETCELSLGIDISRYRTSGEYIDGLKLTAARNLRQGMAHGMHFASVESASDWEAVFALLVEARRRRRAEMKISLEYVMGLRAVFGARIAAYALKRDGRLAAAALVYRVSENQEYLVSWGDDIRDRKDRAMNVMAYHLVSTAILNNIALFDLGISSVNGSPDDGLINFKRNIGGTPGLRIDFRLEVSVR